MVTKISDLRAMTEGDLIKANDAQTNTANPGTYYLDELHRRDQLRAIESSRRLAFASFVMTAVSTVTAIVAIVIALAG